MQTNLADFLKSFAVFVASMIVILLIVLNA